MADRGDTKKSLEAIRYSRDNGLSILDQLQLPGKTAYMEVTCVEQAWTAIKNMNVRGAPAIAIVAMLALAVEAAALGAEWAAAKAKSVEALRALMQGKLTFLETSRPTAVNLRNACTAVKELMAKCSDCDELLSGIISFAEDLKRDDLVNCRLMGRHCADAILQNSKSTGGIVALTHCNTGSLATAGFGTALGVIRMLHEMGRLRKAYCTETRPYNQGSRLTAFELAFEGIDSCLICDDMAGALMNGKGKVDKVDAVVVGADRVARNGDTANKIGTYQLAVLAKHHGIPFYVVCPLTTIDLDTANGEEIPIEERSAEEMARCGCSEKNRVAAEGIEIWNPAFDVTPNQLITGGVVTELGVFKMPLDTPENLAKLKK